MKYLFVIDSKDIRDKFDKILPNIYVNCCCNLKCYKYKGNDIYINNFEENSSKMGLMLRKILNIDFNFDKIIILTNSIQTNDFKLYVNYLANHLVVRQTDVIVFYFSFLTISYKYRYYDSMWIYTSAKWCCFWRIFDLSRVDYSVSKAIYIDLKKMNEVDYNPEYFINYFHSPNTKNIKSEKIIRDEKTLNNVIPIIHTDEIYVPTSIAINDRLNENILVKECSTNIEPTAPLQFVNN